MRYVRLAQRPASTRLGLLLGYWICLAPCVADEPIVVVPGSAELFLDARLVESSSDLQRTLCQPQKEEGGNAPVLALDDEFGGRPASLKGPGTILYDGRLRKYVMLAGAYCRSAPKQDPERSRLYRFTSPDGLHWIKGDDGSPQQVRMDLNDADGRRVFRGIDTTTFYYDRSDPAFPYKGWVYFVGWEGRPDAIHYVRSRDGITWERNMEVVAGSSHTLVQDGRQFRGPGDTTKFAPDPVSGRFLMLAKFTTDLRQDINPGNYCRSRAFCWTDRLDRNVDLVALNRVDLVPALQDANGDSRFDEYYSTTAWRYGSHWLGALKVWHGVGDYPYSAAGCAYLKLITSHDGLQWSKVSFPSESGTAEVWLPNGEQGGNNGRNDGGYINMLSQGPLPIGDDLIYYYGASSFGKLATPQKALSGGGIFRSRLRLDGFVAVTGGTLTTRLLRFDGNRLLLNSNGRVLVELLDTADQVRGRREVVGDRLRHRVWFAAKDLGDLLEGGAGRLRLTVGEDSAVYAFAVQKTAKHSARYRVVDASHVADEPACAPAMTRAANGDVVVTFSTRWEPWPSGGVVKLVVSSDQGQTWSKPRLVYQHPDPSYTVNVANGMATLKCGDILLPVVFSKTPMRAGIAALERNPHVLYDGASPENIRDVHLLRSRDHGRTWTLEPTVFKSVLRCARLLETRDGRLVLPMYEYGPRSRPVYVVSRDRGKTWGPRQYLNVPPGANETNLVEAADGSWFAVMRNGWEGRPRRTFATVRSDDGGAVWKPWQWTTVQGKMPDLHVLPSGRILMAVGCEGLTDGSQILEQRERGSFVRLFVSDDHGQTWQPDLALEQVVPGSSIQPTDSPVMCLLDDDCVLVVMQARDMVKQEHPLFGWSVGQRLVANTLAPLK